MNHGVILVGQWCYRISSFHGPWTNRLIIALNMLYNPLSETTNQVFEQCWVDKTNMFVKHENDLSQKFQEKIDRTSVGTTTLLMFINKLFRYILKWKDNVPFFWGGGKWWYYWCKQSCTTWDVKSPPNDGKNYQPQVVSLPDFWVTTYRPYILTLVRTCGFCFLDGLVRLRANLQTLRFFVCVTFLGSWVHLTLWCCCNPSKNYEISDVGHVTLNHLVAVQ